MIRFDSNNKLKVKDVIDVFESVGWSRDFTNIIQAFGDSYYITAYDGKKLVGFARAITDYYYYVGLYDVVVHKDYQNHGIGTFMLKQILDNFDGLEFILTQIGNSEDYFGKFGFEKSSAMMYLNTKKVH